MKQYSPEKFLLAAILLFASITNANAESYPSDPEDTELYPSDPRDAARDPRCYEPGYVVNHKDGTVSEGVSDKKKRIHLDVAIPDPIPAGGQVSISFSKSTVPSGEMEISPPVLNPDFVFLYSSTQVYTYRAPNHPADYNERFTVSDKHCKFSESLNALKMRVR